MNNQLLSPYLPVLRQQKLPQHMLTVLKQRMLPHLLQIHPHQYHPRHHRRRCHRRLQILKPLKRRGVLHLPKGLQYESLYNSIHPLVLDGLVLEESPHL